MTATREPSTRKPSKPYPTRAHYPPVEPVICPNGPLLYANLETSPERAGHYYKRNADGIWVCANCKQPRP